MKKKEILVLEDLLGSNKKIASEIRKKLTEKGILTINLLGSPGAGKTTLLERIAEHLKSDYKMAVIEGDIETEGDDKPKKYPKAFTTSDCLIISKTELIPPLPFNKELAQKEALEIIIDDFVFICTQCGSRELKTLSGTELLLEKMELEV